MNPPDLTHPDFADFYDELPLWSAPFALRLLERAPMRQGQTALDLGCGTGFLTLELAQRCGPDSRIYAVDPWGAAMARLERKLAYHGVGNVELLRCDGADTGLGDGVVDLVVSNLGVNNFADPDGVLREMVRVLKPDGRMILTTNVKGHMGEVYAILREIVAGLGDDRAHTALERQEDRRGSAQLLAARMDRAGFGTTAIETSTYRMRFADGTALLRHWFMRLAFVPDWLAVAGPEAAPRIEAELEAGLNALAAEAGELAVTIPLVCIDATKRRRAED